MTWLKIPDFDYEVSIDGEVRRLPTFIGVYAGRERFAKERILRKRPSGHYCLSRNGDKWWYTVDQLLDMAYGDKTHHELCAEKVAGAAPANRAEKSAQYVKDIVELYERKYNDGRHAD